MKANSSKTLHTALASLSLGALLLAAPSATLAGPDNSKVVPEVAPPPSDQWIHALLQLDFSDHYITPRGLNVTDQGLVFQPLFLVFWDVYHDKSTTAFLNDITITTGLWNDFDTHQRAAPIKRTGMKWTPSAGSPFPSSMIGSSRSITHRSSA